MSEHYKHNVTGVSKFCKTCNKRTIHRVSVGRVGGCTEQHLREEKKKEKGIEEVTRDLFKVN